MAAKALIFNINGISWHGSESGESGGGGVMATMAYQCHRRK